MKFDAVVIGGGIYGCKTALALRKAGLKKVMLIERNARLMQEASRVTQSRIHRGFHYPRSLETARAMNESFDRFCIDHWYAITPTKQVYAIAAQGSKVNAAQFEAFCGEVGLPLRPALDVPFRPGMIEAAYEVEEAMIDSNLLEMAFKEQLETAGVEVRYGKAVTIDEAEGLADYVFDVTYSNLKCRTPITLAHCEIILLPEPPMLQGRAVLVLDGPFWSCSPYPTEKCWQMTHVTKMLHDDEGASDGPHRDDILAEVDRWIPGLGHPAWSSCKFMTRAVIDDPTTDSRPSLWEYDEKNPKVVHVLGGKLSGIYDIEEKICQMFA